MIKQEDLVEVEKLWNEGEYFDYNLLDLGRMAAIYEVIIKTASGKYYRAEIECDEEFGFGDFDEDDFDEDDFEEVVPREIIKIEYFKV